MPRTETKLGSGGALYLVATEGPITRLEVMEKTGVSERTANETLKKLYDRGLVERQPDREHPMSSMARGPWAYTLADPGVFDDAK